MELADTELYHATALGNLPPGLKHTGPMYHLQLAAHWAKAYMPSPRLIPQVNLGLN